MHEQGLIEENAPVGRPGRRSEYNIKMDPKEIVCVSN